MFLGSTTGVTTTTTSMTTTTIIFMGCESVEINLVKYALSEKERGTLEQYKCGAVEEIIEKEERDVEDDKALM